MICSTGYSQGKRHKSFGSKNWDFYRHEFIVGIGLTNYLGELGGNDGAPVRFSPKDMEWSQFKYGFELAYRYNLGKLFSVKPMLFLGKVAGSDKLTENPQRKYRNLSFSSKITEFALLGEFHIVRAELGHSNYHPGVFGSPSSRIGFSLHGGIATFSYNPKVGNVALRELSTEGQGLEGGPKAYKKFAVAFPVGFELGYQLMKNFKLGIDFNFRFTNTDYLDDASGVYFDKEKIRAEKGDFAAEMSNKTSGINRWSDVGSPRGNPNNKDFYFSALIVATYTPLVRSYGGKKRRSRPKF